MKLETNFFEGPARILRGETVMDTIQEISGFPGQEDAFMILNIGDVVQKIKNWRLKIPRVKPFYAVKCNDDKVVLRTLAALGTGFDCASKSEMKKVMEMGISPSRVIFAHPCKPSSHIRQANAFGVDLMTFDNENELFKVKDIMPEARLVLRIRCDAAVAQCPLGMKFGADQEMIVPLLTTARNLGLNVVGISFHVGSGCQEPQVFLRAISMAREAFDDAVALGFNPYLLDIGGGFPGTSGSSLDEAAEYINAALDEHFPDESVKVIAEPGRYVVASACTLVTQVVSKRRVNDGVSENPSFMYYINDGVYGSFNCTLYDHQEVFPTALKTEVSDGTEEEPQFSCSIWGPTCDSMDQVVSDVKLPEMDIGDWIVWEDMGAYTIAAAGTFNGFPLPHVHVVVPFHTWASLEGHLADNLLSNTQEKPSGLDAVDSSGTLHSEQSFPAVTNFSTYFEKDQDNVLDHLNTSFSRLNVVEI